VGEIQFYSNLGELRGVFGSELGILARRYKIDVAEPLSWIIPPIDPKQVKSFVPAGEILRHRYFTGPPDSEKEP
jgi:hypothetical protein